MKEKDVTEINKKFFELSDQINEIIVQNTTLQQKLIDQEIKVDTSKVELQDKMCDTISIN